MASSPAARQRVRDLSDPNISYAAMRARLAELYGHLLTNLFAIDQRSVTVKCELVNTIFILCRPKFWMWKAI